MGSSIHAGSGLFKDSRVAFQTSEGVTGEGAVLKLTRFSVSFENTNAAVILRLSEVLGQFTITAGGREIYAGRATVKNILNTNASALACEVTLDETAWRDVTLASANGHFAEQLVSEYALFHAEWQKLCKLSPGFRLVLSDMETYFSELRLWLDQLEAGLKATTSQAWPVMEQKILQEISALVLPTFDGLFERFEAEAVRIEEELRPAHRQYMRRQLHGLIMASPFAWRTYYKPLGYAGDYEMVNMILREAPEGKTLFAKVLNLCFVGQAPAQAHRNRITYLVRKITEETTRCASERRDATVMSLACGPANEVERFVGECHIANHALFTLLDFNEETLQYTQGMIMRAAAGNRFVKYNKPIRCIRKNIPQLVKESLRGTTLVENQYDFVYCAGLFDYLSDQVCHQILETMYRWLAPGGLMVATNVADALNDARPYRYSMEYLLDWNLVYRNQKEMEALVPVSASREDTRIIADSTGVNLFLEIRKPEATH